MATLYGKGIWLLYSTHIDLAVEMAQGVGATHLLYRTGHQCMFFVEAAQRVLHRAQEAGLIPLAWLSAPSSDPAGDARVALRTAEAGYQGIVLDISSCRGPHGAPARELGQRLLEAGLNPQALYYAAPPNISQRPDLPYTEMNDFCKGGFMPQSYPTLGKPAQVTIHKLTYEEHGRWSRTWGCALPIYPVLAAYRDQQTDDRLTPEEFSVWVEALAEHHPPFLSIFHAAATDRALWPVLARLHLPGPPRAAAPQPLILSPVLLEAAAPSAVTEPAEQPLIVTVEIGDTVWSLCEKYGCSRAQFWEWNGYLWDERGWPRDANYLQAGWRVRLG